MVLTLFKGRSSASHRAQRHRCRVPAFDILEDRIMLSTVTWIGGTGDWNTATNWSDGVSNRLPGPDDDAVINVAGISVTHSSGSHTVKSLTINDPFTLSGGTLIVTGNLLQPNANTFTMAGGTLRSATVVGGRRLGHEQSQDHSERAGCQASTGRGRSSATQPQ